MNNKKIRKMLPYAIFVLGLLATLSIFLPALSYEGETYSGLQIAFGKELVNIDFLDEDIASAYLPMNMYAFAAYFSPVFAGLFTLIFKRGNTFALAMFVLAGVLFFILNDYIEVHYELLGVSESEILDWSNNYGIIVGAFASILAAIGEMMHISMTENK